MRRTIAVSRQIFEILARAAYFSTLDSPGAESGLFRRTPKVRPETDREQQAAPFRHANAVFASPVIE